MISINEKIGNIGVHKDWNKTQFFYKEVKSRKNMSRRISFYKLLFIISAIFMVNHKHPLKSILVSGQGHGQTTNEPEFLAQLNNMTVPQGRDVFFTCVVNNLDQYRVAWIKSDSKAILGIHTHMVSLNPRLSVTHNGHNTWKLHISHVQLSDSGSYMCQINTDPMKSIFGHLTVVVPPDILSTPVLQNYAQSECNEGGSVTLLCKATGVPEPQVQWRREGGKDIILRNEPRDKQAYKQVDGEILALTNVQRVDMGEYFCIASNGVPPSVSKRFEVHVNFPPSAKAVNQLVIAPIEREVTLECLIEVYPKPLNGWQKVEGNMKLHNSFKYNITEELVNPYTWHLNLTIRYLTKADFGTYMCISTNALGKSESTVRLQELRLPPILTTTQKPRWKQTILQSKKINEVVREKGISFIHSIQEKGSLRTFATQESSLIKDILFTTDDLANFSVGNSDIFTMVNNTEDKFRNTTRHDTLWKYASSTTNTPVLISNDGIKIAVFGFKNLVFLYIISLIII